MARGQRKTIEDKIREKQEMLDSLLARVETEKKELEELYRIKKSKELEAMGDMIVNAGLNAEELAEALKQYLSARETIMV